MGIVMLRGLVIGVGIATTLATGSWGLAQKERPAADAVDPAERGPSVSNMLAIKPQRFGAEYDQATGGKVDSNHDGNVDSDVQYSPAKWRQELMSTTLIGYKPGECLVRSDITTGTTGLDAVVRYSVAVKVETLGKPFTEKKKYDSQGKRYRETLKITLTDAAVPNEVNAEFEHTVAEDGKVILRFAGKALLHYSKE
jgi:hypothetical protein